MFNNIFFLLLLLLVTCSGYAQDKLWDHVTVHKAYESGTSDDHRPATLSLTLPQSSASSFLVNAGVGYSFERNARLHSDFTGFFVYNRNTLTDRQQKNYKLGLSSNHSFDLRSRPLLAIFGTSTVQYLHDYADRSHSLIVTSYWQPMYKKSGQVHIGGYVLSDHAVNYFITPRLGFEHQQVIAATAPSQRGFDFRGYFSAGGTLVFKRKTYYSTADLRENLTAKLLREEVWKDRPAKALRDTVLSEVPENKKQLMEKRYWTRLVECHVSYAGRAALIAHQSNYDRYIPLFTASATLYPVRNDNFSVSFSYNNGADPIDGLLRQTYWLLSLNFKK